MNLGSGVEASDRRWLDLGDRGRFGGGSRVNWRRLRGGRCDLIDRLVPKVHLRRLRNRQSR